MEMGGTCTAGDCSGTMPTVQSCVPTQGVVSVCSQLNTSSDSASRLALSRRRCGPPPLGQSRMRYGSGDRDFRAQVYVLNRLQQLGAFRHRALERLAAADQTHAAGALVDHRGGHGLAEVVLARGAAAVDQADA